MSRSSSSYDRNTPDRDYDQRKERERERARAADRYDSETRHHGKWTAASETTELEGSSSLPGAYSDARRSQSLGNRSYSDRESRESYGDRNRSYGNYADSYQGSYGSIPAPPPMPSHDFWMPHNQYKSSHPYNAPYGHTSYDGQDLSGTHPMRGHHQNQFGGMWGARDIYHFQPTESYGYDHGYGGYHPGMYAGDLYSSDLYSTEFEMARLGLGQTGSRSVYSGAHHPQGASFGRHLELGTTRPHCDIYELGNEYIIEIDLPGHSRDHIETKLFGNELVITSRPPKREHSFHINERPLGRHEVTRKFFLPVDVNSGAIGASLTNGVLRLVLPRSAKTTSNLPTTTTVVDTTGSSTTTSQTTTL